jgi:hypothetical protein
MKSLTICLMIFVLLAVLSPLPAAGQNSPPFSQCPPIGVDSSCAILIILTDNGISVATDPSQGPFDQVEDTLIGVQNNSSKTVFSLPLSSPNPIFSFDSDGLCAPFTFPQPSGCPFGATGYEGPGVSFSSIGSNNSSGIINFAGGIPPGGSAYFSLELAIQTLCQPISGVSLFKQFSLPWGPTTYDGYPVGDTTDTIKKWGCALTSSVMVINYHAFAQGSNFRTDPGILNTWLSQRQNHGYVGLGAVNWYAVAQYARQNGVQLFYQNSPASNDFVVDNYLCTNNPVILRVTGPNGAHFVVATGQTTVAGNSTFLINDPGYDNATLQAYPSGYSSLRTYSSSAVAPSALVVSAHSPVELLVTDPNGLRTGFDSSTVSTLTLIPSSTYLIESIGDDENPTGGATTPEVKSVEISTPLSGQYLVQVIGTGSGDFSIDFLAYDSNANSSIQTFAGKAEPGAIIAYNVDYSSLPGSGVTVVPVDTTPPTITISAAPSMLWPPNGKMVPVTVSGMMSDSQSGVNASTAVFSVLDEYGRVQPQGSIALGAGGNYSFTVLLEPFRDGNDKDGRTYTITVSARDNAGNLASISTVVSVPHDQGQ